MAEVTEKPQEVPTAEEKVEEVAAPAAAEADKPAAEAENADAKVEKSAEAGEESTNGNSKLDADIIRQVEYYFGDANLNRDKFLLEQISKTEEGWVTFETLLTFKRLAALTTNIEKIVNALHKSDEGLLEISDDKTKVRRHPERPIPEHNEERRKEISSRTAYCKGFPLEAELSDIIEFFNPFDKVVNITMRKYLDKPTKTYKFKGSVFVTFAKKEQLEEFLAKEKVEFQERELIRKPQEGYLEEKREERKKNKKPEKVENKIELPKGTVLHFGGATDSTTRESIRAAIEALDEEVAYIDFSKGDKEGHIRLVNENTAAPFFEKLEEKKLKLKDDADLTLTLLTEEQEKEFLDKAVEHMKTRRTQQNRNRGHHGSQGNHGNRKRGGNRNRNEEPRSKAAKAN